MILRDNRVLIVIISAFLLTLIFHIVYWLDSSVPLLNYRAGEVAQVSLQAPFSFDVIKSEMMIEAEVMSEMQSYAPQYIISEEINFNMIKKLDKFFLDLNSIIATMDSTAISSFFANQGFMFTDSIINFLLHSNNTEEIYKFLTVQISNIIAFPIINDGDVNRQFRMSDTHRPQQQIVYTIAEVKQRIIRQTPNPSYNATVYELLDFLLVSNLEVDTEIYNKEKQERRRNIDTVIERIENNTMIIEKNRLVTEFDILVLNSFKKALEERKGETKPYQHFLIILGRFLFNILILSTFYFMTLFFYVKRYVQFKRLCVTYASFVSIMLIILILHYALKIPYIILIPIPMFTLLITMMFSTRYCILFIFFTLILSSQYLNWDIVPLINLTFASMVCIIVIRKTKQTNFLLLFIYLLCALGLASLISAFFRLENVSTILMNLTCAFINSIVSVIGALLLIPLVEKKLGFATKNSLINLMDYNSPILRRLAKEAQGTYYHSVIVGNLAEECAMAVGADHLLARVGSYYHDIGKLENPEYFSENNKAENPHDTLNPLESATIIKNHVKNGILHAKKVKLPEQVIEIIQQHHGDNKIKYFLHKAKDMNIEFDEKEFMYDGPKPKTKEASIVMIADVVESTAKASIDQSESAIKKIIEDSINNIIAEEQLSDSPLTIQELAIIKETILPIMCSIYRKRIEYPDTAKLKQKIEE